MAHRPGGESFSSFRKPASHLLKTSQSLQTPPPPRVTLTTGPHPPILIPWNTTIFWTPGPPACKQYGMAQAPKRKAPPSPCIPPSCEFSKRSLSVPPRGGLCRSAHPPRLNRPVAPPTGRRHSTRPPMPGPSPRDSVWAPRDGSGGRPAYIYGGGTAPHHHALSWHCSHTALCFFLHQFGHFLLLGVPTPQKGSAASPI